MKCIRIVSIDGDERDIDFNFAHERRTFLLLEGFLEQNGHWFHPFTHTVAGFYDKGDIKQRETCIRPVCPVTGWSSLLKGV